MASSTSPTTDDDVATAVGQYILGELSLGKAAEAAGVSRWEFEELLEEAGYMARYGPQTADDLQKELDVARDLDE